MNPYSTLLILIKDTAQAIERVNTVTKGDIGLLDIEKANIFQLVHINIESGSLTNGSTIKFNVDIAVLQQRDINPEVSTDKFWRQDNEVDNHNETLATIQEIWLRLKRDWKDVNITASEDPGLTKIEYERGNILDGWGIVFEVEMPTVTLDLCN